MPTATFTAADIDFVEADGPGGGLSPNWDAVAAAWPASIEGDSGVVVRDFTSGVPTDVLAIFASPHDDGVTVPPVITITNLNFQFDWAITNVSGVGGNVSDVGAGDPPPPNVQQAAGATTGHYNEDADPLFYFGAADRSALFAVPSIVWNHHWIPSTTVARTSGRVAVSSFVLVVTYTVPASFTSLTPDRGTVAGGTLVTLTGTGFTGSETVNFDGVAATVEGAFADGTKLTVRTPAHAAGLVDVEVVAVATLTNAYTYLAVISVTPNTGTTLGGTPVTIRGGGFLSATGVEFDGVAVGSYTIVSDTTIKAATPAHAEGLVDVAVLSVGTGIGLYTYRPQTPVQLPPVPVTSDVADKDGKMGLAHTRWLMTVKKAVENMS